MADYMYGYLYCTGDYYILLYLDHGRLYVRLLVLYWWLLYFVISWAWQIICMVTCTGDYHILLYLEHGRLHVWFLALVAIALVISWAWLVTCMVTCTGGYCICYILSMAGYMYGYLHWWLLHLLYLEYGKLRVWLLALVAITFVISWVWQITCMVTCTGGYHICYNLHWWLSHLLYLEYGRLYYVWLLALVAITFVITCTGGYHICYILSMAGYI